MSRRGNRSQAEEILARHMAQKGLKSTRQRSLIVGTFLESAGHISVDDLLARVRVSDPRVSAATVYRTMKLLTECGLAHARHFGDGQTRYETAAGREHHDHLICTGCGTIIEFENDRIEAMQDAVARMHGFRVSHHKMELYGLCRSCQRAEQPSSAQRA
ncbi:MAG: Fur family transcriptional regulator [Myxococcales bacterium]